MHCPLPARLQEGQRAGQAVYTNAQGQSRKGIWKNDKASLARVAARGDDVDKTTCQNA